MVIQKVINYIHRVHSVFVMNAIEIKCTVCFSFNHQSINRITVTAIWPFHWGFHMLQKDLFKKAQLYTMSEWLWNYSTVLQLQDTSRRLPLDCFARKKRTWMKNSAHLLQLFPDGGGRVILMHSTVCSGTRLCRQHFKLWSKTLPFPENTWDVSWHAKQCRQPLVGLD